MKRYVAPMPPQLRRQMRAGHHPARAIPCPHCGAKANRPCVLRKSGRILADPHPQRVNDWALTSACCPQCQVTPGTPCHDDGIPRRTVHDRRIQEAETTT